MRYVLGMWRHTDHVHKRKYLHFGECNLPLPFHTLTHLMMFGMNEIQVFTIVFLLYTQL